MRYFGIRFVLRILFLQRSQRQATQKYRKKERPKGRELSFRRKRESRVETTKILLELIVNFEINPYKRDIPLFRGHFLQQSAAQQS